MNFLRRLRARLGALAARMTRPGRGRHLRAVRQAARATRAARASQAARAARRPDLGAMPDARALATAARARGEATFRAGAFDQWSFDDDVELPYLAELRMGRDEALGRARERAAGVTRWEWQETTLANAEAVGLRGHREILERQRHEADAHRQGAWARINHLARLEARLHELRHFAGLGRAADETTGGGTPAGEPLAGDPLGGDPLADEVLDDDPPAPADAGDTEEPVTITLPGGPPVDPRAWEGPHAPRITARWAAVILFGLVLVEVPIQYVIFQYFHGYSPFEEFLTWVFTIPVSAVMVLLPHLSGWWYRSRTATGSDRLMRAAPLLLLLPWAYLAGQLGYLRARVLLAPATVSATSENAVVAPGAQHVPSNADLLHVTPATMSVMFVALILGVGGIGFLLGLAREHPFAGAYSGAAETRDAIAGQLGDLAPAFEIADQQAADGAGLEWLSADELADREEAIRAAYDAAVHAYLDGIVSAAADPAITAAVTRMSRRIGGDGGGPQPQPQAWARGPQPQPQPAGTGGP